MTLLKVTEIHIHLAISSLQPVDFAINLMEAIPLSDNSIYIYIYIYLRLYTTIFHNIE